MANPQHVEWLLEGVEAWNQRRLNDGFTPDFENADIYREFRKARKLDRHGRIPLAGVDFGSQHFYDSDPNLFHDEIVDPPKLPHGNYQLPDFSTEPLDSEHEAPTGAKLTGAILSLADLIGADLSWADLTSANLSHADFSDADLSYATLSGANLTQSRLINSNLNAATLTSAYLFGADLTGSSLRHAEVTNANLVGANFSGANLAGVEVWKAILYTERNTATNQLSQAEMRFKTISEFLEIISSLSRHHSDELVYFRGESNSQWELRPSVMRNGLVKFEGEMLTELIARRPEEFSGRNSALGQWVLAQHYRLRTRFLDITKNPLVALFCACEGNLDKSGRVHVFVAPRSMVKPFNSDTVSIIANFAKLSRGEQDLLLGEMESAMRYDYPSTIRRLYQLIREEKPDFEERIDITDLYRVFVVEPQQSSERIRAQSGAFLASAFQNRFESDEIVRRNARIPVYTHYKLTTPYCCKVGIMQHLQLLNITRETLFPGLDASADAVTDYYGRQLRQTSEVN